jgi:hypothetical protein
MPTANLKFQKNYLSWIMPHLERCGILFEILPVLLSSRIMDAFFYTTRKGSYYDGTYYDD